MILNNNFNIKINKINDIKQIILILKLIKLMILNNNFNIKINKINDIKQ